MSWPKAPRGRLRRFRCRPPARPLCRAGAPSRRPRGRGAAGRCAGRRAPRGREAAGRLRRPCPAPRGRRRSRMYSSGVAVAAEPLEQPRDALVQLGAVAADDAGRHQREDERLAARLGRRSPHVVEALPQLLVRGEDGVVLVGEARGEPRGARPRRAADDHRRARLLQGLRPGERAPRAGSGGRRSRAAPPSTAAR